MFKISKKKMSILFIFSFFLITTNIIFSSTGSGWLIFKKTQSPKPRSLTTVAAIRRGDISGVIYNPSILSTLEFKEVFTIAELGIVNDSLFGIIYGHPLEKSGLSVGFINYNLGREKLYYIESNEEKSYDVNLQNDFLGFVSYGRKIYDNLSIGATAKIATTKIIEQINSLAYAIDIGGIYFYRNIGVSFAIQNLGKSGKFLEKEEKLPTSIYLSLGNSGELPYFSNYFYGVGFDIAYLLEDSKLVPGIGVEINRTPLSIFLGYKINVEEGFLNFGLAVNIKNFEIGYTYIPSIFLNSSHRLSLGFKF